MLSRVEFPKFTYIPQRYNSDLLRGVDLGPRPFDFTQEILSKTSSDNVLLDIGCGSASKLLPLVGYFRTIYGIDKNPNVIFQAARNVSSSGAPNIELVVGDGNNLPVASESIDMITYMLCPHNAPEALRVLKKGKYVVADRVGEQDKSGLKQFFVDKDGNSRGYRSELSNGEIARIHVEDFEKAGFQQVTANDYFWQTKYTPEGLWALLNSTPTIKDFDNQTDRECFEQACAAMEAPEGITLTQHIAQK